MRMTLGKMAWPEWPCEPKTWPRRTCKVSRYMGTRVAARPTWAILPLMASDFSISGTSTSGAPAASTLRSAP